MKNQIAIIDLGSNSARLMVARYTSGEVFKITDEISRRVRLSEGMTVENILHESAIKRAFDTLRMFKAFCASQKILNILPVATAAVRDADNGQDFLDRVEREIGLKFRLLDGEEEAFYGAVGVINGLGVKDGLVLDIGGGSAEISLIRQGRFIKGTTKPFGAIRLTESYFAGMTVEPNQLSLLNQELDQTIGVLDWVKLSRSMTMTGIGGTIRALARIDRTMRRYPLGLVHGYELKLRRLEKIIQLLVDTPVVDRTAVIPGLQTDREDIILAGALVVAAVMKKAGAKKILVSGQGLREGLFYENFVHGREDYRIDMLRRFSVLNLMRLYGYENAHTAHVAHLSLSLFDQLHPIHQYNQKGREYLWAAAMLHDIGTVIDYYDHHKHSAYIILNAGLPGFTHREVIIIAALCLNHRTGKPDFSMYHKVLRKKDIELIYALSSLLRLAEYLDRSRTQSVSDVTMTMKGKKGILIVTPRSSDGAAVEMWEAQQNAKLFRQSFGVKLQIEEK